jgi:L-threonylcarbamoyladenylate synthase
MTPWHIREAVRTIAAGGVIAYPTDTIYGLGCDPLNAAAVLHLLDLKQRGPEQGVILIASRWSQLRPFLQPISADTRKRLRKDHGRPVTWLLPAHPDVPVWLRGRHSTLAVRVTRHPAVSALCDTWDGPLVSTSANRHGRPPARNPLEIHRAFGDSLDYVLHGPAGTGRPSEIRDGLTGRVLRGG